MILLLACVDPDEECIVTTGEIGVDDAIVEAYDNGDEERERTTPADLLAAIAGPSYLDAVDLGGVALPLTVGVSPATGPIVMTDASPDWCEAEAVSIPVLLEVVSDDGQVSISAATALSPDLPSGTYWLQLTADLASSDVVPAGVHGAAERGSVSVTWGDGVVTEMSVRILTTSGSRETVVWYVD